jgi:hypothetical protein
MCAHTNSTRVVIFAWPLETDGLSGLLANNPDDFRSCGHMVSRTSRKGRSACSMTNRGLPISLMAAPWTVDTYLVRLPCVNEVEAATHGTPLQMRLGIYLRR